ITLFYVERADGTRCCETRIERTVTQHKIRKIDIKEQDIVGYLCLPAGEGSFPGMIVLGGSNGGYPSDSIVAQFADQGFAALGLAYFKVPSLPQDFVNIPLEYFKKAIHWMQQREDIDSKKLVIVGLSMGGTAALLIASHFPEIKAVISICGRGIHFQSTYFEGFERKKLPTFSFQGKPLPYLSVVAPPPSEANAKTAYFLRIFLGALFDATPETIEQASAKVEKIQGPILLLSALDDRQAGSAILSSIAFDRLVQNNFPHQFDHIVYKGTGHSLFSLPFTPSTVTQSRGILFPLTHTYDVGGIPSCIASAQVDVWKQVFTFCKQIQKGYI
ncbi:MAG: acyl-CoA thioester hydrolase/BAAT C-terminal domain-containing protein, partial [Chlamydiales bacterium]